jgi:oligosaccharide repeat unit polymerase
MGKKEGLERTKITFLNHYKMAKPYTSKTQNMILAFLLGAFIVLYSLTITAKHSSDVFVNLSFVLIGILSSLLLISASKVFSITFLLGLYSFLLFFCVPFHQYVYSENIWHIFLYSGRDYLTANLLIALFLSIYLAISKVSLSKTDGKKPTKKEKEFTINNRSLSLITIIDGFLFITLLSKFGLSYFSRRGETFNNSISDYFFLSLLPCFTLCSTIVSLYSFTKKKRVFNFVLLLINLCFFIVLNPISRQSRGSLLVLFFVLFGLFNKNFNNKFIFIVLSLIGAFFLMPLFNYFKTLNYSLVSFTINFEHADYDAYEMLLISMKFTESCSFFFGKNILSAILFFIPRSIWKDKMLNSGEIIMSYYNATFTNVSCPLVAEFFLSGGVLGVFIFTSLFSILSKKIDKLIFSKNPFSNFVFFALLGMFFPVFRGSLLQAISFTSVYIIDFWIIWSVCFCTNGSLSKNNNSLARPIKVRS